VKQAPPEVSLWVARDVAPGPKVRLTLNTRNVATVRLVATRLRDTSWLLRRDRDETKTKPQNIETGARSWLADMRPPKEKKQLHQIDIYRSRQINLPNLPPGIYLVEAQGREKTAWGVVNITSLAVVTKRSPKRLLTWVTDFKSGAPIAGARVELWNRGGKIARNGAGNVMGFTGRDGVALLPTPPGNDQVLIVSRGDDHAGVPVAAENPDGKLITHFQTDRPIYRPGQKVLWKSILRRTEGRGWRPLRDVDCAVQVRDARDIVIWEGNLTTNAIGTLHGSVSIPEEGSLGQYSVTVSAPAMETQYGAFSVAAYRKPEFQVAVAPAAKRYLSGEKVVFNLNATYYFGAAVPGATVRYIVRRADLAFPDGEDASAPWYGGDGNLYERDTYNQNEVVADATADLDASGQLKIEIPSQNTGGDSTYALSATVVDGSRREVQAAASVPVYRATKRLRVVGDVSYVPVGFLMPLRLRVTDLDGKPTGGTATLVLRKPVWNEKEGRDRYVEVTRTKVVVPDSGNARATLPAQAEGQLRVEASLPDGTGRTAFASWSFWVAGPLTSWQREDAQPTLTLKPDKKMYRPGEVAKVLVATNVGNRPVLAVQEGLDIWGYTVIPAGKRNFVWPVTTKLEMSPNAHISAAQWTNSGLISDNAILPIPDPSRKLRVSIAPDKTQYRPGETARYTLRTTDEAGRGVPAEVAVSVVDESLYSVRPDTTPDPYALFWALRPNAVTMSSSAPEELSGGAYQRVNKMASVRRQFLDTAFWNARVQTDATGTATFTVEVPGNLTTWRATARAITGDTRVGIAKHSVLSTRPVTFRLATPRQLVQGDELTLIGSVNNRTKTNRTFETAISAQNLQINGPRVQKVEAKAGGEGRAQWPTVANVLPESGEAKITGRTLATDAAPDQGEELSDALETAVKVVPNGVLERIASGGTLENSKDIAVTLPADAIKTATSGVLSIRGGVGQVAQALGAQITSNSRYTSPIAASRLLAAALLPGNVESDEARENIALLSRYQTGQGGWGWWEDGHPDAQNTAFVLSSLARARARAQGVRVPNSLLERGIGGAKSLYNTTQLWEHRALLASAITLADKKAGAPLLDEVERRAENLSPFARLTLAEAILHAGNSRQAAQIAREVLSDAVVGPDSALVPVGERAGWSASSTDATSAALSLLVQLGQQRELQAKLARAVADEEDGHNSPETLSNRMRALWKYDTAHPSATRRGQITVLLNGNPIKVPDAKENRPLEIALPRAGWKEGANSIQIRREGRGELFYALETRVFRPAATEFGDGVRVFRRFDVQNAAKVWGELGRAIRPGEPVRCTVVVWPREGADALRVTEPLPAGFEYIESDASYGNPGRDEVRDGAVVHYVRGNGLPLTFRYYMRAESEGSVTALPASAEVLRRPSERGHSDAIRFEVKAATDAEEVKTP
jgi:uncharacterized protein YfaS (alpha-2-macroglobulin family)